MSGRHNTPSQAGSRKRCFAAAIAKLGLGTAQFGLDYGVSNTRGRLSEAEARATLAVAAEGGLRLIDTAAQYGDAETALGRALPASDGFEGGGFRVVTKTASLALGLEAVELQARASLVRMGIARADALLVHQAADLAGPDGPALWTLLRRLKDEGLFQAIGISAYASDDPVALARRFAPDIMQLPVSLLDQRLIENGALAELAGLGVEVHLRSIFLQGLLFLPRAGLPGRLAACGPRLSRIQRMIAEAGADPLQAALAFALNRPEASAAIVGVASAAELRAILAAAAAPTPSLDWAALSLDDPLALDPRAWAA